MIENQTALVVSIKQRLIEKGVIPNPQETNCHAFEITCRVAWALREFGAKLFLKNPSQNGCTYKGIRYSHDAISFPDGWVDCLISAGPPANVNEPTWQWTNSGAPNSSTVADPIDLDNNSIPVPESTNTNYNDSKVVAFVQRCKTLTDDFCRISVVGARMEHDANVGEDNNNNKIPMGYDAASEKQFNELKAELGK